MNYSISEVAKKLNITASTLRYYDKEGLLPFVDRSTGGIRVFKDEDFEWLNIIECLKNTNMPIKDIKNFIDWCMEGDSTLKQRYELFYERQKCVEAQMAELQKTLETIKFKRWYYETALEAGTIDIHKQIKKEDIPEDIRAIKERLDISHT